MFISEHVTLGNDLGNLCCHKIARQVARKIAWCNSALVTVGKFLPKNQTTLFLVTLISTKTFIIFNPFCTPDLSAMIRGAIDDNFLVKDYKEEDIPQILKEFFNSF